MKPRARSIGALLGAQVEELLEDEVREATLRGRVGRGLGDAFDRGVLVATRAGLEIGEARRGEGARQLLGEGHESTVGQRCDVE